MMEERDVVIVSAFTHQGAGGNLAAVVLDADNLSEASMQSIATQTGLSETAFLSRSAVATYRLDFFTPRRRIAHCGHATVAAFGLLEAKGLLSPGTYSKQTVDGTRVIKVDRNYAGMQQRPPRYEDVSANAMLEALGVTDKAVDPRFAPIIVNTGNSFALVGLRNTDVLSALKPDFAAMEALSERHDLVGFYPFVAGQDQHFDAVTRMFAPSYGINEESATGMAAGPLACLLHLQRATDSKVVKIGQGAFMTPPSASAIEVRLTVNGPDVVDVLAGGTSTVVTRRAVRYEA